jgi:hypothetical protein
MPDPQTARGCANFAAAIYDEKVAFSIRFAWPRKVAPPNHRNGSQISSSIKMQIKNDLSLRGGAADSERVTLSRRLRIALAGRRKEM